MPTTQLTIDQMLGGLNAATAQAWQGSVADQANSLWTTFNIDALAKPSHPQLDIPIVANSSVGDTASTSSLARFMPFLKKVGAFLLTCLIIVLGYWFISVQYPIETQAMLWDMLWFFSRTFTTVQNNISSDTVEVQPANDSQVTESAIHNAASDEKQIDTPLAKAILEAQGNAQIDKPTSIEQTLDIADPTSLDAVLGTETVLSGVASSGSTDVLFEDMLGTEDAVLSLRNILIDIKEQAEQYLVQSSGSPSSYRTSLARALSSKSESLLSSSSSLSSEEVKSLTAEVEQLKVLASKLQ